MNNKINTCVEQVIMVVCDACEKKFPCVSEEPVDVLNNHLNISKLCNKWNELNKTDKNLCNIIQKIVNQNENENENGNINKCKICESEYTNIGNYNRHLKNHPECKKLNMYEYLKDINDNKQILCDIEEQLTRFDNIVNDDKTKHDIKFCCDYDISDNKLIQEHNIKFCRDYDDNDKKIQTMCEYAHKYYITGIVYRILHDILWKTGIKSKAINLFADFKNYNVGRLEDFDDFKKLEHIINKIKIDDGEKVTDSMKYITNDLALKYYVKSAYLHTYSKQYNDIAFINFYIFLDKLLKDKGQKYVLSTIENMSFGPDFLMYESFNEKLKDYYIKINNLVEK